MNILYDQPLLVSSQIKTEWKHERKHEKWWGSGATRCLQRPNNSFYYMFNHILRHKGRQSTPSIFTYKEAMPPFGRSSQYNVFRRSLRYPYFSLWRHFLQTRNRLVNSDVHLLILCISLRFHQMLTESEKVQKGSI